MLCMLDALINAVISLILNFFFLANIKVLEAPSVIVLLEEVFFHCTSSLFLKNTYVLIICRVYENAVRCDIVHCKKDIIKFIVCIVILPELFWQV